MATATEMLIPASPEQLARLSADLVALGDRLETQRRPEWVLVARAAALVDGLRLGVVCVDAGGCHGCQSH